MKGGAMLKFCVYSAYKEAYSLLAVKNCMLTASPSNMI